MPLWVWVKSGGHIKDKPFLGLILSKMWYRDLLYKRSIGQGKGPIIESEKSVLSNLYFSPSPPCL